MVYFLIIYYTGDSLMNKDNITIYDIVQNTVTEMESNQ